MHMSPKPQLESPNRKECVADSRSTSAGSRASRNRHGATGKLRISVDYSASVQHVDLPDYEYPVPVIVRNTFIDTKDARPDSLEAFFQERRIHSSPAVPKDREKESSSDGITIGAPLEGFFEERRIQSSPAAPKGDGITFGAQGVMSSVTGLWKGYLEDECPATPTSDLRFDSRDSWSDDAFGDSMPAPRMLTLSEALPVGPLVCPATATSDLRFDSWSDDGYSDSMPAPRVLTLSEAFPVGPPVLGSPEMPTMGSAGHYIGQCKPCSFFHKGVCENGVDCTFCHLCPADEKRRRQKEKHAAYREMRRQRKERRQVEQRRQNTIVAI